MDLNCVQAGVRSGEGRRRVGAGSRRQRDGVHAQESAAAAGPYYYPTPGIPHARKCAQPYGESAGAGSVPQSVSEATAAVALLGETAETIAAAEDGHDLIARACVRDQGAGSTAATRRFWAMSGPGCSRESLPQVPSPGSPQSSLQ